MVPCPSASPKSRFFVCLRKSRGKGTASPKGGFNSAKAPPELGADGGSTEYSEVSVGMTTDRGDLLLKLCGVEASVYGCSYGNRV